MKSCCVMASDFRESKEITLFLYEKLRRLVEDYGIRRFYVGMMLATERTTAELLVGLSREFPELQIDAVLAWEGEADHWDEGERDHFFRLMASCRKEIILKPLGGSEQRFQRNLMMMNRSDLVFLVGEDDEVRFWARKKSKPLIHMKITPLMLIPDLSIVRDGEKCQNDAICP